MDGSEKIADAPFASASCVGYFSWSNASSIGRTSPCLKTLFVRIAALRTSASAGSSFTASTLPSPVDASTASRSLRSSAACHASATPPAQSSLSSRATRAPSKLARIAAHIAAHASSLPSLDVWYRMSLSFASAGAALLSGSSSLNLFAPHSTWHAPCTSTSTTLLSSAPKRCCCSAACFV